MCVCVCERGCFLPYAMYRHIGKQPNHITYCDETKKHSLVSTAITNHCIEYECPLLRNERGIGGLSCKTALKIFDIDL